MQPKDDILPDYIQKYLDAVDYDGYPEFVGISLKHAQELKDYDELIYPVQAEHLRAWNKARDQNKTIDREAAIQSINEKYHDEALKLAKSHGYVEETEKEQPQNAGKDAKTVKTPDAEPQPPVILTGRELKIQKFKQAQEEVSKMQHSRDNEIERE